MMWQESITDTQLFDYEKFQLSLAESSVVLKDYKQALQSGNEYLNDQFEAGDSVKDILYRRAWLIDQLL
ncbi:MAG: hypothetical protein HOA22_07560, partial [Gammaproteobacteria bacterium]|nr:hypothetical protein [Gammaproteobacteria bacterium]